MEWLILVILITLLIINEGYINVRKRNNNKLGNMGTAHGRWSTNLVKHKESVSRLRS
jgi:hypothetical protein